MMPVLFCVSCRGACIAYGTHHLHFITGSCYRRLPFLSAARTRDRFLSILEETRQRLQLRGRRANVIMW
jgi:hypothetical protein